MVAGFVTLEQRVCIVAAGPTQAWWLPSSWHSIPSWGMRCLRYRWRGRRRGLDSPARTKSRLSVGRDNVTPSRSANNSVIWVWLMPLYRSSARSITRCRMVSGVALGGTRPRFLCARAAAPSLR